MPQTSASATPPLHGIPSGDKPLMLCFSHRIWEDRDPRLEAFARHAATDFRLVIVEEPLIDAQDHHRFDQAEPVPGALALRPRLPPRLADRTANAVQRKLLDELLAEAGQPDLLWYMSPAAMAYSSHMVSPVRVYDAVEDLAKRSQAAASLPLLERRLLGRVDAVFAADADLHRQQASRHSVVRLHPSPSDGAWDGWWSGLRAHLDRITAGKTGGPRVASSVPVGAAAVNA